MALAIGLLTGGAVLVAWLERRQDVRLREVERRLGETQDKLSEAEGRLIDALEEINALLVRKGQEKGGGLAPVAAVLLQAEAPRC